MSQVITFGVAYILLLLLSVGLHGVFAIDVFIIAIARIVALLLLIISAIRWIFEPKSTDRKRRRR